MKEEILFLEIALREEIKAEQRVMKKNGRGKNHAND